MTRKKLTAALCYTITVLAIVGVGYAFGCWLCGGKRHFNRILRSVYGSDAEPDTMQCIS